MKKLKIYFDQCGIGESPREWDNLGIIAYKHSRYCLGEEQISDPIDWLEEKLGVAKKYEYNNDRLYELEELFFEAFVGFRLYLYDHSGQTISTTPFHCPWDSGQVGYIYTTKERMREWNGVKRVTDAIKERAAKSLLAEVKEFDLYIRGDVYRFEILDEEGFHVDSCGGFYGQDWENNGMKDHVPEELWPQLEDIVPEVQSDY